MPLHKIRRSSLLMMSLAICAATPAFAEDADTADAVHTTEIESLETKGLYVRSSEGSLGPDLWKGAKRSVITADLKEMPATSPENYGQNFIRGLLLTKTDGGIENDKPVVPGEDLFTLRLEKLLNAGLYKEASALYAQLPAEPSSARLAYAGALALLFEGDKSSGCIEARAGDQSFAGSGLFTSLIEYCNLNYITAPVVPYNLTELKNATLERLATIAGDNSLDAASLSKNIINEIPPAHIPLLLKAKNLSDENRLLLSLRAVHWGLMSVRAQQDYYNEIVKAGTPAADWKKIPESYVAMTQTEQTKRWPALRQILSKNIYGIDALLPFAEMLEETRPLDINYSEIVTATQVMIRAGLKISPQWAEIIRESVNPQYIRPHDSALLGVAYLTDSPSGRTLENKEQIFEIANQQKNKENFFVNYIIENIDKSNSKVNNNHRVYEKDYRLTFDHDYVMPSDNVWHRLLDISQDSSIGETVLLSTLTLDEKTLPAVHPDALIAMLKALEKVGLTDTSERLATAALIGSTFKGEN